MIWFCATCGRTFESLADERKVKHGGNPRVCPKRVIGVAKDEHEVERILAARANACPA